MITLFSLIMVYLLQKYLSKYAFIRSLQQKCSADWINELLFKYQMLINNFPKIPNVGATFILVIVISILVIILRLFFYYTPSHLGVLIFNVSLLFYCLSSLQQRRYSSIFVAHFEHTLAPLFWFTVLGAVGLILYWLFIVAGSNPIDSNNNHTTVDLTNLHEGVDDVNLANQIYSGEDVNQCLSLFHILFAWFPARLTGLIFSLIGNFRKSFDRWQVASKNFGMMHSELLDICGRAALGEVEEEAPELLLERAFVAWMILCIMLSLII